MATAGRKLKIECPTTAGNTKTLTINEPKTGLTLAEVTSPVTLAASINFINKNGEKLTGAVTDAYYEEVVITSIVS